MTLTFDLDLSGDMGGMMGLLLGASVMTVCEFLDLIVYNSINKCVHSNKQNRNQVSNSTSKSKEALESES